MGLRVVSHPWGQALMRWRPYGTCALAVLVVSVLLSAGSLSLAAARQQRQVASSTSPGTSTATSSGNLLVGRQASFSGTTGGWVGMGATLTWAATPASSVQGSLQITSSGTKSPAVASGSPQTGGTTPARPGQVFDATAMVQGGNAALPVQMGMVFYNSSGSILKWVFGQLVQAPQGRWTSVPAALGVAPVGTTSVVMGIIVTSSAVGNTVYLEQPQLESAPGSSSAVVGPLHTSGNQVLDANGSPVILRGVNMFGLQSSDNPLVLSANNVAQAKQWGANFVRIALSQQLWLSSSCGYDPNYAAAVDKMVDLVTSSGMVALLDLHYLTPGSGCGPGGAQPMADAPGSTQFWQQVAARYAGNPLVAFDLYNEPENIPASVWLSGGQIYDPYTGSDYQAAGMQQLYDAVRSTGAANIVFISGDNWGNTPPSQLVRGSNIVYAAHAYTCPVPNKLPPQCTTPSPYDPSSILGQWVTLSQQVPVAVTEFGWPTQADGTYMANVVAYATAHGWGWSAFAWDGDNTSPWSLLGQVPAGGTFEPTPSGAPVLAALAGLPENL